MATLTFTKMHGLGNSYVYIDLWKNQVAEDALPALAQFLACPNFGIGGDGMILMGPSQKAAVKMRIFNKDGSEGRNCGNGLRCVASYVYQKRIVTTRSFNIETLGGIVSANIISEQDDEAQVSIDMGLPKLSRSALPMKGPASERVVAEPFQLNDFSLPITTVSMGNPHAIFFVPEKQHSLHLTVGPKIEKDARFPEGVNVEFITIDSPTSLRCRVWERGSGATQACGTGACASAVAAVLNGFSKKNEEIAVHLDGGTLQICWKANDEVWMTGPAKQVATGIVYLPADLC